VKESEKPLNEDEGKKQYKVVVAKPKSIITKCEHTNVAYYAQGLCRNCYHSKGR